MENNLYKLIYVLIIPLIYLVIIFSGLCSALLLRCVQKLFLSNEQFYKLQTRRMIDHEEGSKDIFGVSDRLTLEDALLSFFRGLCTSSIVFYISLELGSINNVLMFATIIATQLLYFYKNWRHSRNFKSELFLWIGDIPGTIVVFSLL